MRAHTIAICNFFTKLANLHLHFLNFCKFCNFIYQICKLFFKRYKKDRFRYRSYKLCLFPRF